MRELVRTFLSTYVEGEAPDDWLVDYVAEFMQDSDMVSSSISDLADMLSTSCPAFDMLGSQEKLDMLGNLSKQVACCKSDSIPASYLEKSVPHGDSSCPEPDWSMLSSDRQPSSEHASPTVDNNSSETAGSLSSLRDLCPSEISEHYLTHVLQDLCGGDVQRAAEWLLEAEDILRLQAAWEAAEERRKRKEKEDAEAEKKMRKQMLSRFMLQECNPVDDQNQAKPLQAWSSNEPSRTSTVRYRDGMVATTKGEKYVVQKLKDDWDGGSKGKVYTKGKRGKGFV